MMANLQFKFLLTCLCILVAHTTKGVDGQCATPPVNQAYYEGTNYTILTCDSPTKVSYVIKPTSDPLSTYTITNYDDAVSVAYNNLYAVNKSGLIIKIDQGNAAVPPISTAGLYVINPNGTNRVGAKLVVVREPPTCGCKAINATRFNITCSMTYADVANMPINAMMKWTINGNPYQTDTPPRTASTLYYTSTSTITVTANTPITYACTVTFTTAAPMFAYVAQNAPKFNASCSISTCSNYTATTIPTTLTSTKEPTTTVTAIGSSTEGTTTEGTTTEGTTTEGTTTEGTTTEGTTTERTTTEGTTTEGTTIEGTTTEGTTTEGTTTEGTTPVSVTATPPPNTECVCTPSTACPTPDQICTKTSECRADGSNRTDVYNECVVKAESYARCDSCCSDALICGVVVTLRNDSRWLIYDPQCDDNKCEMSVVSASCMSSEWKQLSERKVTIAGVGDYVQAGYSVQLGLNVTDCSDSCKRMMNLP